MTICASKPRLNEIDYVELFSQLRNLIPKLRSGELDRVIYGNPDDTTGHEQYHQLSIVPTPGGDQFAFHLRIGGRTGSGDYIGFPKDDEEIIKQAQHWIQYAHRSTLSPAARKWLEQRLAQQERKPLEYFGA